MPGRLWEGEGFTGNRSAVRWKTNPSNPLGKVVSTKAGANKPSVTTATKEKESEVTTPINAADKANDMAGIVADAGDIAATGAAKGLAAVANNLSASDVGVARNAASASLNAVGVSKGLDVLGRFSGVLDAGIAIKQAIDNPTVGNVTKALVKSGLAALEVYGRINPVIGLAIGILDVTNATDSLFKLLD